MKSKITLLSTGIGNIQSVANVLSYIGAEFTISDRPEDLDTADKIIFPGVGTFGNAMEKLNQKNLFGPLTKAFVSEKKPVLGICVGMQVLAQSGLEFGQHEGLGIIEGSVVAIDSAKKTLRLPHIGWNNVQIKKDSLLFKNIPQNASFYFLHSYCFKVEKFEDVSAWVDYGEPLAAAVERENIFGVQFHPEKSQELGVQLFKNFVEM